MKGPLNPQLEIGDVIVCFHMEGETSVPPGTVGVVRKITRDPFEESDAKIVDVQWENGSNLNLITITDAWKKIEEKQLKEQRSGESSWRYIVDNPDIFEHFDWRYLREFLFKLRDTGIVNMFGAAPLLYAGKEHIDRYYGEGREDDENFQNFLDEADVAKNKMIMGVLSYMEKHNKDIDNIDMVNRYARNFANKITGLYIALSDANRTTN